MQNNLIQCTEDHPDELAPGALLLLGQYQIESYLIRGGFGITYLARDSLDRRVVIKECFPGAICCRIDGQVQARARDRQKQFNSILRHFLREARRLSRLSHASIVGVHQVFEENSTAYMALDYVDGMDLLSVVEEDPARLTPELVKSLLIKSLGAINYIHDKGILHRDIAPDNFLLDSADKLTLIDFGAARENATKENRALSSLLAVKDGYSPQEFYLSDVTQYPSSDLYALGATFYHLITGAAPPDSQQRLAKTAADAPDPYVPLSLINADYDADFLNAIDTALEIFPQDRIQSAQDWVEAIDPTRRTQAAETQAGKDTIIQNTVSRLVAESNLDIPVPATTPEVVLASEARPARATRTNAQERADQFARESKTPPACPVDMFGTPIHDVEAWLWAQDSKKQHLEDPETAFPAERPRKTFRKSLARGTAKCAADNTDSSTEKPAKSTPKRSRFLTSLMGRLSPIGFRSPRNP